MLSDIINQKLRTVLKQLAEEKGWLSDDIEVECNALSVEEASGTPEEQDDPVRQEKEVMLQVAFHDSFGQAFSREVLARRSYTLNDVLELPLESDWQRAVFIATANAVFAEAGEIDRTVHCPNHKLGGCSDFLGEITSGEKVGLFGLQPRFLEKLAELGEVRCVDIDPDLIGSLHEGIRIEGPENTQDIIDWADRLLVTGSAAVNHTFSSFVDTAKPLHVFGATGAAMCHVLGLPRYCKHAS